MTTLLTFIYLLISIFLCWLVYTKLKIRIISNIVIKIIVTLNLIFAYLMFASFFSDFFFEVIYESEMHLEEWRSLEEAYGYVPDHLL